MKIHKGSGSYHFTVDVRIWLQFTPLINIRYICMHRPYNHTWPHMVSLLFDADMHIDLLYFDAPFFYSYSCFWMGFKLPVEPWLSKHQFNSPNTELTSGYFVRVFEHFWFYISIIQTPIVWIITCISYSSCDYTCSWLTW